MKYFDKETVIAMHRLMTDRVGGSHGLRDEGLLESAIAGALASFGGVEVYPTLEEKAARLAYSLIANHAFCDGNKRIGVLAMLALLSLNGAPIFPTDEELVWLGLGVAAGELEYEAVLAFVREWRAEAEGSKKS